MIFVSHLPHLDIFLAVFFFLNGGNTLMPNFCFNPAWMGLRSFLREGLRLYTGYLLSMQECRDQARSVAGVWKGCSF